MSSSVTLRAATFADAKAFYGGKLPPWSFQGIAAELDGEVIGLCGLYRESGAKVVFSEIRPQMRKHKKAIGKACRMLMQMADKTPGTTHAVASPTEPTAGYLLAKLGFVPTGEFGPVGEILVRG